jgi:hypothetical protein
MHIAKANESMEGLFDKLDNYVFYYVHFARWLMYLLSKIESRLAFEIWFDQDSVRPGNTC